MTEKQWLKHTDLKKSVWIDAKELLESDEILAADPSTHEYLVIRKDNK